jgi:hypothetical protein
MVMKKITLICCLLILGSCEKFGELKIKTKLPQLLEEVSGIQYSKNEDAFWMINDSGNASSLYLVSEEGNILRELKINSKNTDWEDITQDKEGNMYIGNFGNNANKRKDLVILKVHASDLKSNSKINVENIEFYYPEQKQFPAKEKYFDTEGFFEWNDFLYIFTKSRVKNKIGKTFLYRIPNKVGNHPAELISDFTTCSDKGCWITAADISNDGRKVILLNHKSLWVFEKFTGDDFFSGTSKEYPFYHTSQKESITFKNETTIFLADEDESGKNRGRNLYLYTIQ